MGPSVRTTDPGVTPFSHIHLHAHAERGAGADLGNRDMQAY